ncbi:MAG: hypothetical protein WC050_00515 [Candidatus Paceibacterota bacterium]
MIVSGKTSAHVLMEAGALYAAYLLFWGIFETISGIPLGYTTHPIFVTLYALAWIGISLFNFQNELDDWHPVPDRVRARVTLVLLFAVLGVFYTYVLPALPVVGAAVWWSSLPTLGGDPIFIIPKAFDIFFQQVLIIVSILALSRLFTDIRVVSLFYALGFGLAHLSLLLQGSALPYAGILAIAALGSAVVFPYLILRVKNGVVYTYSLHWLFYVALALLLRV